MVVFQANEISNIILDDLTFSCENYLCSKSYIGQNKKVASVFIEDVVSQSGLHERIVLSAALPMREIRSKTQIR